MALVFCTTCEKIIDDRSLIPKLKRICPRCRKKLVYFGREEVSLSPEEIIAEYDKTHQFDPVSDFTGKVETVYEKQSLDLDIIECEDSIKHEPNNIKARQYLAMRYYSQSKLEKAREYFHEILNIESGNTEANKGISDILICKKEYKEALSYLEMCNKQEVTSDIYENYGIIYVHLKKVNRAITYFLKAYKHTKDKLKKSSLKKLVSQLISSKS